MNKEILVFFNSRRCLALSAITLASLSLTGCFTDEIDFRQAHEIQGLLYKIHDEDPFTGRVINFPMSVLGVINVGSCTADFKKGLPDGEVRCSDNAGNLLGTGEFKEGKRNGKEEKFDAKTGEKTEIGHWASGRQDGLQEQFNPQNGERILEVHYTAGKKDGRERAWDEKGDKLIADLEWENGLQSGFDNRGFDHSSYLNGKKHGLQKHFSLNGNRVYLAREENYENDLLHGDAKEIDPNGNVTKLSVYEHNKLRTRTEDGYDSTGKHLHHTNIVPLTDDVGQYDTDQMGKDGSEQYWDENGRLIREIHWRKGEFLGATATAWAGDRQAGQFQGVMGFQGTMGLSALVKHGQEQLFSDNGELQAVIFWDTGEVRQILAKLLPEQRSQYPGKMGVVESLISPRNPVNDNPRFVESSNYVPAREGALYERFVDIPAPDQAVPTIDAPVNVPVATPEDYPLTQAMVTSNAPRNDQASAAQADTNGDLSSCVQRRVDAVHAEDPEALVRADMLEEFEQECL